MPDNDIVTYSEEFENFVQLVKKDKADRRLHPLVEKRLTLFLSRLYPGDYAVAEVSGVLGGRNDLMQFSFNGRRIVFELFFSPSQVPQDLRLLEQAKADVKVAILLDPKVNPKVASEYFHKKPDHFPYLWLSCLLVPSCELLCSALLRELIDEDASINRLRRILSSPASGFVEETLSKKLEEIEDFLERNIPRNSNLPKRTVSQVAAIQIISRIRNMGLPVKRLSPLYAWLQNGIHFAFTLVALGFQAFLITDLEQHFAIWSDSDLADDLFAGAEDSDRVCLVLCLNKIINDLLVVNGLERQPLRWNLFHIYEEQIGKIIPSWELDSTHTEE
jgi:hypothetical protein